MGRSRAPTRRGQCRHPPGPQYPPGRVPPQAGPHHRGGPPALRGRRGHLPGRLVHLPARRGARDRHRGRALHAQGDHHPPRAPGHHPPAPHLRRQAHRRPPRAPRHPRSQPRPGVDQAPRHRRPRRVPDPPRGPRGVGGGRPAGDRPQRLQQHGDGGDLRHRRERGRQGHRHRPRPQLHSPRDRGCVRDLHRGPARRGGAANAQCEDSGRRIVRGHPVGRARDGVRAPQGGRGGEHRGPHLQPRVLPLRPGLQPWPVPPPLSHDGRHPLELRAQLLRAPHLQPRDDHPRRALLPSAQQRGVQQHGARLLH
mmetsp:Transcript_29623/g.95085  ORF Transcript_29623/g.95085 Transcript_29623/m.95085 type:complete len:310 (-) Transcript_29623:5327-6256(-)